MRAFADPFALTEQDRIEGGEARWQTLGMVEGRVPLLVAHTFKTRMKTHRSHSHHFRQGGRQDGDETP